MEQQLINLVPLPVAFLMVVYVHRELNEHFKNCPIQKQLDDLNKKVDMVLEHMLERK